MVYWALLWRGECCGCNQAAWVGGGRGRGRDDGLHPRRLGGGISKPVEQVLAAIEQTCTELNFNIDKKETRRLPAQWWRMAILVEWSLRLSENPEKTEISYSGKPFGDKAPRS